MCFVLLPFLLILVTSFTFLLRRWRSSLSLSLCVRALASVFLLLRCSKGNETSLNGVCFTFSIPLHRARTGEIERELPLHSLPHTYKEREKRGVWKYSAGLLAGAPWKGTGAGGGEGCQGEKGGESHIDGATANNGGCLFLSLIVTLCVRAKWRDFSRVRVSDGHPS